MKLFTILVVLNVAAVVLGTPLYGDYLQAPGAAMPVPYASGPFVFPPWFNLNSIMAAPNQLLGQGQQTLTRFVTVPVSVFNSAMAQINGRLGLQQQQFISNILHQFPVGQGQIPLPTMYDFLQPVVYNERNETSIQQKDSNISIPVKESSSTAPPMLTN